MSDMYPEHEKMSKIVDKSQAIGEFLDWLQQEKGAVVHHWVSNDYEEKCPGSSIFHFCVDGKRAHGVGGELIATAVSCTRCKGTGKVTEHFEGWMDVGNTSDLLAEFFGIDLKKIEQEKRAMLDSIREANA